MISYMISYIHIHIISLGLQAIQGPGDPGPVPLCILTRALSMAITTTASGLPAAQTTRRYTWLYLGVVQTHSSREGHLQYLLSLEADLAD